jgi:predicted ATPase
MSKDVLTIPQVFARGSTWIRADFHLHTRADKEFVCNGDEGQFVARYVARLKEVNINVGVVTNHNKFDRDEYRALAKAAFKEEVFLLPGVELSVKDGSKGVHTLIVFSLDWIRNAENTDYVQRFLNVTFANRANYENENCQSNHNIDETIHELNKFGKDYFLVFAHVEAENGLWGAFGGQRIQALGGLNEFRERCLGFQKVITHDKREQVKRWLSPWYPAQVEGSDCKSIDEIGKGKACFIMIGAFTFEAVRYALLDHANRVNVRAMPSRISPDVFEEGYQDSEAPEPRHSRINSISFEGGKLDRTIVRFSPGLNTFIGVRGSGKSSIIESLRYALGIELPENADSDGYKQGTVRNAVGSGGKITVTATNRHEKEYEIRRILNERPDVYANGTLQSGINILETILHKPIYFGQKDLSSKGQGFESDLIERLVGASLAEIRQLIAARRQTVVETIRRLQKLSTVEERQQEYTNKLKDAEHRLEVFKEHGVEAKLQKQVDFEQDARSAGSVIDFVDDYLRNLDEFIEQYKNEFIKHTQYASKRNARFYSEFQAILARIAKGFDDIGAVLSSSRQTFNELKMKRKEFEALREDLKEEFAEVNRALFEKLASTGFTTIDPDEFLRLRKAIENAKGILEALKKEKAQRQELEQLLDRELTNLNDLWHKEFQALKRRLDSINQQSEALRIDIEYKGDKAAFLKYIKDILRGSNIREATLQSITDEFADGPAIYRSFTDVKDRVGKLASTFEKYFMDNLSAFLTWQVPNRYAIKYHGKELRRHSLGQRASALILFVLSQRDNDVIIIDQPEDDLDNQTIYEDVIKLVRQMKPTTQFIFATHNPNIPVLGDAQQVIACDYSEERINTQVGSIDIPEQQEAIVRIMEGGREAFQRRKEIYQAWKSQNS